MAGVLSNGIELALAGDRVDWGSSGQLAPLASEPIGEIIVEVGDELALVDAVDRRGGRALGEALEDGLGDADRVGFAVGVDEDVNNARGFILYLVEHDLSPAFELD